MNHTKHLQSGLSILAISFLAIGACHSQQTRIDRRPAVAGQFYPAGKAELNTMLGDLFAKSAPSAHLDSVVAIICPHAGYVYSGDVAASGFNQINVSKKYDNIFIIGSSHYVAFEGASIYDKGDFMTPLGTVEVNTALAKQLVARYPFFSGRDDAHAREHCIEVEIPFLQYRLKKGFRIVPIILGTQDPGMCRKIAEALHPYFNTRNLFVISSDFSHYPAYKDAATVDHATADAILSNSSMNLLKTLESNDRQGIPNLATSLCGWSSVLTLLNMTESDPSISLKAITYKNSGDSGPGDKSRVVGYYAIAVSLPAQTRKADFSVNDKDGTVLLSIAERAIEQYVVSSVVPDIDTVQLSPTARQACGAFVTLRENNQLRGCIGLFEPNQPLYKVVQQMAIAAATQDVRFPPVSAEELPKLDIEISVLTPLRKIHSIDEIKLGRDGIYLKKGMRTGTFLPEVAAETGWSKEEFLGHCAQDKAGIGWDGWKDAEIYVYQALVFHQK
jgi:MEMO1 family protein